MDDEGGHTLASSRPTHQAALQEALRLNPPGWMTSRECVEDIDIDGWRIPKGSVVYIDIRGIQRSPGEALAGCCFPPEQPAVGAVCCERFKENLADG